MTGLEKVTGKIIADAEADARVILEKAEAECEAIKAKYAAETEAEVEKLTDECDRECQALVIRARSSAAMAKRNAVLEARAKLIDDAYAAAEKQIRNMNGEQYLDLLQKMLRSALKSQLEGEEESMRLYGEDISPAVYEVVLNSRDRETYGEKLLEAYREGYGARLSPATLAKLRLAPDTAPIDGGIILRCGPVEANCSLSMLMAANRRETEARVSRILFGDAN
jgi:V/A-type H+-transporting ATPase subunit E